MKKKPSTREKRETSGTVAVLVFLRNGNSIRSGGAATIATDLTRHITEELDGKCIEHKTLGSAIAYLETHGYHIIPEDTKTL